MVKKKIKTNVLDIGARYGVHPTWKNFTGEKEIILIEPDKKEFLRLKKKYRKNYEIRVFSDGIAKNNSTIKLNIFDNPAMSSSLYRKDVSPLFWGERKNQLRIKKTIKIKCKSLDNFIYDNNLSIDFLKIDVEGLEPEILNNSYKIFNNLLGLRSEVNFTEIFKNNKKSQGTFAEIHKKMLNNDFTLLNLDYDGRGDHYSKFLSTKNKYGILQNTDAVWIKNLDKVLKSNNQIKLFKIVSFLILNNAFDVAIHLLEKSYKKYEKFKLLKKTKLYNFVKIKILKHFYKLKWTPGQKIIDHKRFYEKVFGERYLSTNKYNENNEINPY